MRFHGLALRFADCCSLSKWTEGGILGFISSLKSTLARFTVGLLSQGMLSIANFVMGVLIIRNGSKEDYGCFVLIYSLILLGIGFQNALITTPMAVIAPRKNAEEGRKFCHNLAVGQFFYWLPLTAVSLLFCYFLYLHGDLDEKVTHGLLIGCVALLAVLLREFIRSLYFLRQMQKRVLALDASYSVAIIAGFATYLALDKSNCLNSSILALGLASMVSIVSLNLDRITGRSFQLGFRGPFNAIKECWSGGKWALLGVVVTWLHGQSYIYLLTLIAGSAETAEVSASRLLLSPLNLLIASYGVTFRPQWAVYRHSGRIDHLFGSARKVLLLLFASILLYTLVLFFLGEGIIVNLFSSKYTGSADYLLLWGVLFVIQALRNNYSLILQVFEEFRYLTLASALVAFVTITASALMIKWYGNNGSLLGMLMGEVILCIILLGKSSQIKRLPPT